MSRERETGSIRLRARVALGAFAVVALVALGLIFHLVEHEREILHAGQDIELIDAARHGADALHDEIGEAGADVILLSRMPPVRGVVRATLNRGIDPRDGVPLADRRERLGEIFLAFVEAHPQYPLLRFIGVADNGRELVRVDGRDGHAAAVAPDELQARGDRDYFIAATKLKAGQAHISDIELDHENGRAETPRRPVLRVATPVFAPDGRLFGVVVIDVDFHYLVRRATVKPTSLARVHLANMAGDFLLHPDAGRAFGRGARWQEEFPGLPLQEASSYDPVPRPRRLTSAFGPIRAVAARVGFDHLRPERHLTLIYALPEAAVESRLAATRVTVVWGVAVSAALVMALLWWAIRRAFKPLGQLTKAAASIAAGRYDTPIPEVGADELGELGIAFSSMQAAVAAREAEYRAIAESSLDGFWMVDTQGRIIGTNDAYARMSGYHREELLGMRIIDLEAVEQPEETRAHIEKILREGHDLFETEHRRKDGTVWPVEIAANYWPIAEGRFFTFLRDISERKAVEQRLREERDSTRRYLDVAEVFIVVLDSTARIRLINRKGCETLGWSEQELIGQPWVDYCAEAARASWTAMFAGVMSDAVDPSACSEYPVATRDGATRIIEWRRVVLRDAQGKPHGTLSSGRDVTGERQAQQALAAHQASLEAVVHERTADLKASEARSRAILATMLDGVTHIDARGIILSVNFAMTEMFGYAENELVGRNVSQLMPEPHASAHDGYLARFLQTRQPHSIGRRLEVVARRKDGSLFPIELAVNEMVDDAGSTFIGVIRDMTAQKAAERTLQDALEAARAATETKGRFLANMSHEIRTPLNAVLGLARIGMRQNAGRKSGETCGRILESGEHLLGVINDILDFSKIEAGKLRVERRPFALRAAIDGVTNLVAARAEAKGLALAVSLAPDLPEWVEGDSLRLAQILTNLLSNAIKFTERGEVRLRVAGHGDDIFFRVLDTGIGMDEDHLTRLFQPFEQADSSTTRHYGGTGLGLAISQSLVQMMGGDIAADSRPGEGSSFFVRLCLPAVAAPVHSRRPGDGADSSGPRLAGLSVLAVDDVEVNRFVLEDLLTREGARAVFANDGQQALERLEERGADGFDLVLMDVQMPVMDGLEATRRIAAIAPGLPVIGLTAHALAEERDRCLAAGMVEHVTKPIDEDVLVAAILRHARPEESPPEWRPGVAAAPVAQVVPAVSAAAAPPAAVPPAPTFAAGMVDHAALLARFNGRRDFIARLAASACKQHDGASVRLRDAARAGDLATLAFIAHGLKGLGGNLDAGPLREAARALEQAARAGGDASPALVEPLVEVLEATLKELAGYANDFAENRHRGEGENP